MLITVTITNKKGRTLTSEVYQEDVMDYESLIEKVCRHKKISTNGWSVLSKVHKDRAPHNDTQNGKDIE